MSLLDLHVENVRCLEHIELQLHPELNLIWGENGSGKTSILEAIYMLGRGRSFRTRSSARLIRHGHNELLVRGHAGSPPQPLAVQVVRDTATVAKIGGVFTESLVELSQVLPVQAIDPGVHKLVEEGSQRRRRWMDWAVFHVEHSFVDIWARYARALKQRNAALRTAPDQAVLWDPELARLGELLAESRRRWLDQLKGEWTRTSIALLGFEVGLGYSQGWSKDSSLAEALKAALPRDIRTGITHPGPHRADVNVRVGGALAREILSRGQQKLVAVAMILSQLRVLDGVLQTPPVLLLDDPAAELDDSRLRAFIGEVSGLRCQRIITALHAGTGPFGRPDRVFHVEQGRVQSV
jgi:DNA replication and repair protein RecF